MKSLSLCTLIITRTISAEQGWQAICRLRLFAECFSQTSPDERKMLLRRIHQMLRSDLRRKAFAETNQPQGRPEQTNAKRHKSPGQVHFAGQEFEPRLSVGGDPQISFAAVTVFDQ